VIGDSIQIAPAMPKSGHMANSHAKVVAAALVAELGGLEIDPAPMLTNTCYSFVDDKRAMHVTSVHEYVAAEKTFKTVAGSGGLSSAPNEVEAAYAFGWRDRSGPTRWRERDHAASVQPRHTGANPR